MKIDLTLIPEIFLSKYYRESGFRPAEKKINLSIFIGSTIIVVIIQQSFFIVYTVANRKTSLFIVLKQNVI